MTGHRGPVAESNQHYFTRPAERLVLEGYRQWSVGLETESAIPCEMAWDLYVATLGPADGQNALSELANYVKTLRNCASCPLRSFPFKSRHLCTEECLTMGLVSGLQHDIDTVELCLNHLTCPRRCDEVAWAASGFATTLKCLGQVMLPIPSKVIADILTRSQNQTYH